jgi:hypothetical protein
MLLVALVIFVGMPGQTAAGNETERQGAAVEKAEAGSLKVIDASEAHLCDIPLGPWLSATLQVSDDSRRKSKPRHLRKLQHCHLR